jgi:hypothetical protein
MRSALLIITALLLVGVPAVQAQTSDQKSGPAETKQEERKSVLYQWTDGKGVVHITDDLNKIPGKYRPNARKLESTPGTEETPGPPGQQPGVSTSSDEEREADLKEEWRLRMKVAKQKLADAERRYRELEQKRNTLLQSWGGPASGHLQEREEADRIDQQMKQVQKEIDDARNDVEVVIPDEARKAGLPPGWLRE